MAEDKLSENRVEEKPSKLKAWIMELRAPFLTASIIPVILGTAVAWYEVSVFFFDYFILTLIAGVCLHLGANVSNDYFDHSEDETGTDDINVEFIRPFTGGSRTIQLGYLSPREVFIGAMVFFAIGGLIGLYLAYQRGIIIIVLGVIGAGSGFFYTAPPFRFVKRGIGEVFIGLNFGVLMVLGAYYVQTMELKITPILYSLPIAILISAILYINEFPDYRADRGAGKRTIVVRLGKKRASRGYAFLMLCTYLSILLPIAFSYTTIWVLYSFITLPLAAIGVGTAWKYYDEIPRLVPANVATVMVHLLVGLFMSFAFIVANLNLDVFFITVIGAVMFGIVLYFLRGLLRPPPQP